MTEARLQRQTGSPARAALPFLLGFLALGLIAIWAVAVWTVKFEHRAAEQLLSTRMATDALLLEDHVTRSLDAAASRLESIAAFTTPAALRENRLSNEFLSELLHSDRVVRSLSLVDAAGQVVASSTAANVGRTLPGSVLPATRGDPRQEIQVLGALPVRDLHDIGRGDAGQEPEIWLLARRVPMTQASYTWIATINLGLFRNLWSRLELHPATELALIDLRGGRLLTLRPGEAAAAPEVDDAIRQAIQTTERGRLDVPGSRFSVEYRASGSYPAVMAVIGDRERNDARLAPEDRKTYAIAGAASLLLAAALAGSLMAYLRYATRNAELANRARSMDAHLMMSESSPEGTILRANALFCTATGYEASELIGKNHRIFNSGHHPPEVYAKLWKTLLAGHIWHGTFRNRRKDGAHIWLRATIVPFLGPDGGIERFVALYTDITDAIGLGERLLRESRLRDELEKTNQQLRDESETDPLTGVANRRALERYWVRAKELSEATCQPISALMLDLDHFKRLNDTAGHEAGDIVLREACRRWSGKLRSSDLLARAGGEEFVVLLPRANAAQAQRVAETLRAALGSAPVPLDAARPPLAVTVSIGVVTRDLLSGVDLRDMLRDADAALYEAKHAGRDRVVAHREPAPAQPHNS